MSNKGKKLIPIFEQLQSWGEEIGSEIGEGVACEKKI